MEATKTSALQQALDVVDRLPIEDQKTLIELIQRRLVELRRDQIAHNAAVTLEAVREGRSRYGSIQDLKRDLLDEL